MKLNYFLFFCSRSIPHFIMGICLVLMFTVTPSHFVKAQLSTLGEGEIFEYCASSQIEQELLLDPTHLVNVNLMEQEIKTRTINRAIVESQGMTITEDPIVIPVVFHIIHSPLDNTPGLGTNLSNDRIYTALNHLNLAYANQVFSQVSVNTNISFCLASQNSLGEASSGITRYPDSQFTIFDNQLHDVPGPIGPNSVKAISAAPSEWPRTDYMNVWIVNTLTVNGNSGAAGYAYYPSEHGEWWDGIVLEGQFLGSSLENDIVLIHEVGHYLNLKHTFGNATSVSNPDCANDDCLTDNDCVCDTPPDGFSLACTPGSFNSCTTDGDDMSANNPFAGQDVLDPKSNYMDYGNLECEEIFTEGQKTRMRLSIIDDVTNDLGIRGSLLNSQGCCLSPEVNALYTFTELGNELFFDASGSTGSIGSYFWDFGDGTIVSTISPTISHTYIVPGTFLVTLTVVPIDGSGCISTYYLELDVCNYDYNVEFTIDIQEYIGTFTAESENINYFWDFGDGTTGDMQTEVHEFSESGLYFVCLETTPVEDELCTIRKCQWVNIHQCPESLVCGEHICNGDFENYFPIHSDFYPQNDLPEWAGVNNIYRTGTVDVAIDLNSGNIATVWGNWELFGSSSEIFYYPLNPPLEPGCTADIRFDAAVEYPGQAIRVFGFSGDPCPQIIFEPECTGSITNSPATCPDLYQFCVAEISSPEIALVETIFYELFFGDANYPYSDNVGQVSAFTTNQPLAPVTIPWMNTTNLPMDYIVLYTKPDLDPGINAVQATLIDNLRVDSACPIDAEFTYQDDPCTTIIEFTSLFIDGDHFWDFGNGETSNAINPSHNYGEPGDFTVIHTVTNDCVVDEEILVITVTYLETPSAEFTYDEYLCDTDVQFTSSISTGDHEWSFGDGETSDAVNPLHHYGAPGDFTVTHTVTNDCGIEEETLLITVTNSLDPPSAAFTFVENLCDTEVQFTSSASTGDHEWDFESNGTIDSEEENPSFDFVFEGTYSVSHTVTNDCGTNTEIVQVVIDLSDCINGQCECINDYHFENSNDTPIFISDYGLSNILTDVCISVDGRLIVDQSMDFDNCNFFLSPGAEIVIGSYRQVSIANSTLQGCDQMWQGITMANYSTLDFHDNIIKDAHNAIRPSNYTAIGIQNNIFDRNFIGVFTPLPQQIFGVNQISNINIFSGNQFTCSSDLKPGFTGQVPVPGNISFAGILLDRVVNFDIGHPNFPDLTNTFDGLQNGIISLSSNLRVYNASISNLEGIAVPNHDPFNPFINRGIGIYALHGSTLYVHDTEINNCFTGIHFHNIGLEADHVNMDNTLIGIQTLLCEDGINIHDCMIQSRLRGMEITNANLGGLSLMDNFVTMEDGPLSGFGIRITNSATHEPNDGQIIGNTVTMRTGQLGIHLLHNALPFPGPVDGGYVSNIKIEGNTIIEPEDASGNPLTLLQLDASRNIQVRENTLTSNYTGTTAVGMRVNSSRNVIYCCNNMESLDQGTIFGGFCENTSFRGNTFDDIATRGLALGTNTFIGKQPNPNNPDIPPIDQRLHGNLWLNGTASGGAEHLGFEQDDILDDQFFYDPLVPNTLPNPVISIINDWFDESFIQTLECSTEPDCKIPVLPKNFIDDTPNDIDIKIANNSSGYSDGVLWEGQRYLLSKLKTNSGLLGQNYAIDGFYNTNQNSVLDAIDNIDGTLKEFYTNNYPYLIDIKLMKQEVKSLLNEITQNDNLIATISAPANNVYITEKENLLIELSGKVETLLQFRANLATNRSNDANMLITQNNAIVTNALFENNSKLINSVYLETIAKGIMEFDDDQLTIIQSVAEQCPLYGGDAVFKARGLLSMVSDINFDDDQLCEQGKGRKEEKIEKDISSNKISVFPNPASDRITIILDKPFKVKGLFSIYSITGEKIAQFNLTKDTQNFTFDVSLLNSGIYFYEISNKDINHSGKLTILK